jgi:exonuclease VII large subunit
VEESIPTAQLEQLVIKVVESRLQQAIEEYVEQNELRVKELSLIERTVRVEEELRSLREMSESKFEALQREMNARFDASEKRFEALQREMNARFEAVDKRFETVDMRFESLQREMNARFEAMDKRFSTIQWMIGILVGIPAIAMTIIQLVKII